MFFKISVLKNFAIFTGKHLCWDLFSMKACNFIQKETPTQVFSCEYCEILKNNFFYMTPPVAAFESNQPNNSRKNCFNPVGIYLLKVNNRNIRTSCETCPKLTMASFWCLYC